ncbi:MULTISPECIES: alpha/beta hydrolase fold domain-containing protein [Amylolactobacillus]|uniref:alpha/beta hydrolase fold domain-containing protein n=1 Tax=Amylolactobacillus TaxID=2767876 RepID=UPI002100113B|nr:MULTISPECIES: alpha/beta hydrolase fold domain-containing protein [Amylolactobacillus]
MLNRRRGPRRFYPAPLTDMDQVVAWVRQRFTINIIKVIGGSAVGNMAVELAIKYGFAAVSLSGILDIDGWLQEHKNVVAQPDTTQDFTNAASATINQAGADDAFYKWFIMNYLNQNLELAEAATAYHRVNEGTGSMLLVNSLNEFVPTSGVLQLAARLAQMHVPVSTIWLAGTQHAKGYLAQVWPVVRDFLLAQ